MLSPEQTDALVDSLLKALLTGSFHDITLRQVAADADLPLAKVLMQISSKMELLEAFAKRIDEAVLAEDDPDMADEPVRERLFDVLMRRYDALLPHKLSLIQLERDARRDPALALALINIVSASMKRMALSAHVETDGLKGALVLTGMMQLHSKVMRVWLREDDAGQAQTMAELDKALRQAEDRVSDLESLASILRGERSPFAGDFLRNNPLSCLRDQFSNAGRDDETVEAA
jgi:AcrR family transcriptional regulator